MHGEFSPSFLVELNINILCSPNILVLHSLSIYLQVRVHMLLPCTRCSLPCTQQLLMFLVHSQHYRYLFASQTVHVFALYSTFLATHWATNVPSTLAAALPLGYPNTDLNTGLTRYNSGQYIYYGCNIFRIYYNRIHTSIYL